MASIKPLSLGLVRAAWADEVPSPSHDSLTPEARRAHVAAHPLSFLGVTRSPDDLDGSQPTTPEELLQLGKAHLQRLYEGDVFARNQAEGLYLYRLESDDHHQIGIIGGVAVSAYDDGDVRIHERTKTHRALHLARHLGLVRAQSSPIALGCKVEASLLAAMEAAIAAEDQPLVEVVSEGVHQSVWPVGDELAAQLISSLESEPLYLIDGHHRAAAASTHLAMAGGGATEGDQWMLSAIFPLQQLRNKAFHRITHQVDPAKLIEALTATFPTRVAQTVEEVSQRSTAEVAVQLSSGDVELLESVGGQWLLVELPLRATGPASAEEVLADLDPVRLNSHVLVPLLSIDEADAGDALSYVPGLDDPASLGELKVAQGELAFIMRPATMDQLRAVSDAGLVMPPKSTYFEPKVRSGIFLHEKGGADPAD